MEFPKRLDQHLHSMPTAWRGRRTIIIATLSLITFILVASYAFLPNSASWSAPSYSLPSKGSGGPQNCPTIPGAIRPPGHLHFLIAATASNLHLCRALVSSTVNRYGAPILSGWQATGENDAANTHLAKLRVVNKYLEKLSKDADDDLFLITDGYDVQFQLGPDVLIERYFQASAAEDERIIQQLGPANAEGIAGPLGRHVFFGADKVCWPGDWKRPACWAVPEVPGMDDITFGPKTDTGDLAYNRPRWLNSGTIMGPVKEVRELVQATLTYINGTYEPEFEFRESDQYYMAEVWGLQEIERINAQLDEDPKARHPESPEGEEEEAHWPQLDPEKKYNYHVAMDHQSRLFQTWAGYTDFVDWHQFSGPGYSFVVDQNVRGDVNFRPWDMHLQGDALKSIHRIFSTTDDASMGKTSNELIRKSEFGANVVTKTTLPVWHCTGGKGALEEYYPRMWFFAHAKALVKSAIKFFKANETLVPYPVDNRMWYPARDYPADVALDDGGAWSDGSSNSGKVEWLSFESLCAEHRDLLFG